MSIRNAKELLNRPYVDLHIHSYYSDGTMSPQEILQNAMGNKVGTIAITDHNVIAGSKELLEICKNTGVHCISGVELDANEHMVNCHILGYGVNLEDDLFVKRVVNNRWLLEEVNILLIEKMQKDYKEVSSEEYRSFTYKRQLGGWKALHYFVYKGLTSNLMEGICFYKKYNHSYTCVDFPDIKTLCGWIHEAGGVAVLAHPGKVIKTEDIGEFKKALLQWIELGIDGIECYYPSHTKEITTMCLAVCEENGLIITSGSDCHGAFEDTYIGQLSTEMERVNLGELLCL